MGWGLVEGSSRCCLLPAAFQFSYTAVFGAYTAFIFLRTGGCPLGTWRGAALGAERSWTPGFFPNSLPLRRAPTPLGSPATTPSRRSRTPGFSPSSLPLKRVPPPPRWSHGLLLIPDTWVLSQVPAVRVVGGCGTAGVIPPPTP